LGAAGLFGPFDRASEVSHPCDKNKNIARMGHPSVEARDQNDDRLFEGMKYC
jgi:hypothetical protein